MDTLLFLGVWSIGALLLGCAIAAGLIWINNRLGRLD